MIFYRIYKANIRLFMYIDIPSILRPDIGTQEATSMKTPITQRFE